MASLHLLIPVALSFTTEISMCHFTTFHIIQRSHLCTQKTAEDISEVIIFFFFVSLLPASFFKTVKLDVYGSIKLFVVQLTFSLVHVENNSTLEDICFS